MRDPVWHSFATLAVCCGLPLQLKAVAQERGGVANAANPAVGTVVRSQADVPTHLQKVHCLSRLVGLAAAVPDRSPFERVATHSSGVSVAAAARPECWTKSTVVCASSCPHRGRQDKPQWPQQ